MVCRNDEGSFFLFFQNGAWRPSVCVCVCVCVCVRDSSPHSFSFTQQTYLRTRAGSLQAVQDADTHSEVRPTTAWLSGETSLAAELGWSGRP